MKDVHHHPHDRAAAHGAQDAFRTWLASERAAVDAAISDDLNRLKLQTARADSLFQAVEYSVMLPGKRLRPILAREFCRVCGGDAERALPAAIAIECIHTFSLIHDDLPAMDDDDVRRGKPSNHKVFGEAIAILAGDWLQPHAFAVLAAARVEASVRAAAIATLADATKAMVRGQAADIAGEQAATDAELVQFIHLHKTARLIECACRLGALFGNANEAQLEAATDFGQKLGLAFQITDDLLDYAGTAEELGKRVGKDAGASKQTYPAAFGFEESKLAAEERIAEAVEALAIFGEAAERLRSLAGFVLTRRS